MSADISILSVILAEIPPIELIAAVFGFICVVLTLRQNIWCWPAGLIQVTLYVWVFWQAKLYSDMGLHVIYIGMQFYGWWFWMRGGANRTKPEVTLLRNAGRGLWLLAMAACTYGLGWAMATHTDADLPYWDAATTILSLAAQYLMAEKKQESWLLWITVDVLAIGIYAVKGLYVTTVLYGCFLVLATMGFLAWLRSMQAARCRVGRLRG